MYSVARSELIIWKLGVKRQVVFTVPQKEWFVTTVLQSVRYKIANQVQSSVCVIGFANLGSGFAISINRFRIGEVFFQNMSYNQEKH